MAPTKQPDNLAMLQLFSKESFLFYFGFCVCVLLCLFFLLRFLTSFNLKECTPQLGGLVPGRQPVDTCPGTVNVLSQGTNSAVFVEPSGALTK